MPWVAPLQQFVAALADFGYWLSPQPM